MKKLTILLTGLLLITGISAQVATLPLLKVSKNKKYFQTADGKPFFWLGDTGWLLFVKCTREEIITYLETRQQQGFNVIQVMVLHDMKKGTNVYGDSALINGNAGTPLVTPGAQTSDEQAYDYWDHIAFTIDEAAKRGIYVALVPVWGSNVKGGLVSVKEGAQYAAFLARRFKDKKNIIWLNGGDLKGTDSLATWKAIGTNLKKYDPDHLVTFHPRGRHSSSQWFHKEKWLDFNMFQSGHKTYAQDTSKTDPLHFGEDNWRYVEMDLKQTPLKPTMDGEPSYENIPHGLHDSLQPRWTAADLRRYAYWSVFAGGAGFTYGENAVMQFHKKGDDDANYGVTHTWKEAIKAPGASQMQYLKKLVLSLSYFDRIPDQAAILHNGVKYDRLVATKGKNYLMVYSFTGAPFELKMGRLPGKQLAVQWYDPRTGAYTKAGTVTNSGIGRFDPPGDTKEGNDWVLLLQQ